MTEKLHTLKNEYKSIESLFDKYQDAFSDYPKHLEKIDDYTHKIISKSLEKLPEVKVVNRSNISIYDYLPEHLWTLDEVSKWELKNSFTLNLPKKSLLYSPEDPFLILERKNILKMMNIKNEENLEWVWRILDIIEEMLEWASNNRKVKNFMSLFNKFCK